MKEPPFISTQTLLHPDFSAVSGPWVTPPKKAKPAPFSLRLSPEERAFLEAQASGQPLGAYVRSRLLGDRVQARAKSRRPGVDHKMLALLLAELGRSRLSANVNQIAKAANSGALLVSTELVGELQQACQDIRALREMLIAALGLKAED